MNTILLSTAMLQFNRNVRDEFRTFDSSCNKGCSNCCYHPIWVSPAEIMYIENQLKFSPQILNKVKSEWDVWYQKTQGILSLIKEQKVSDFNVKYLDMNIKCPFLLDNLCSIYSFRPLICQTFFTKASPETCKTGEADADCKVFHLKKVGQLNDICKKLNLDNATFYFWLETLADLMTMKP